MEIKDRIIQASMRLFKKFGIKAVTLDEIAKSVGISKKTLYQIFEDKAAIVRAIAQKDMEEDLKIIEKMRQESKDVIEVFVKISIFFRNECMQVNPIMFVDMQKSYPEIWQTFNKVRENAHFQSMYELLKEGIEQGYFRPEIKPVILAKMRMEQILMGFNTDIFPIENFDVVQVQEEFASHFLLGIVTPKGLALFQQYQKTVQFQYTHFLSSQV